MGNLMSRKQVDYFDFFVKGITIACEAAKRLQSAFKDGVINKEELKLVKEIEHKGDKLVHEALKLIDVAFITPIDRTDLVDIIKGIENITDSIEDVANHIYMMHINESNEFLRRFVDLTVVSCQRLYDLMQLVKHFKKNRKEINDNIIEVNRLEEEGDRLYSESMRNLFEYETDPKKIIRLKEMYQLMERSLDYCEDVADMVEMIMVAKT